MKPNANKRFLLLFWIVVVVIFWLFFVIADIKLVEVFDILNERPLVAILVLLLAYAIRPFLLLPTTIMNVFSGHLLGLWPGFLLASLAVVGSSLMGYIIGRYFSDQDTIEQVTHKYPMIRSLSQQSFLVILVSRLMYLPSDLINMPAGFLKVKIHNLILGTLLGSSLIIFFAASFGASVEGSLKDASFSINIELMLISFFCVGISLVASWLLRRNFVNKNKGLR